MEVLVRLEPEDLRALKKCLLKRRGIDAPALVAVPIILWFLFGCGCCLHLFPHAIHSPLPDAALVAGAIMFGYGAIGGAAGVWLYKRVLAVREAALVQDAVERFVRAPWRLGVSATGVTVEAARFSAFYRWSYFPEVIQTGDHVFLLTGHYEGLIVPRRAFPADQAFLDFGESCRRYFNTPEAPVPQVAPAHPTGIKTRPDEFTHGFPNR